MYKPTLEVVLDPGAYMPRQAHEFDAGYTGSIRVKLYNHSSVGYDIRKGDKISQLVIMPVLYPALKLVDALDPTERSSNGFGSTGR